jgi:hypothetical protein
VDGRVALLPPLHESLGTRGSRHAPQSRLRWLPTCPQPRLLRAGVLGDLLHVGVAPRRIRRTKRAGEFPEPESTSGTAGIMAGIEARVAGVTVTAETARAAADVEKRARRERAVDRLRVREGLRGRPRRRRR